MNRDHMALSMIALLALVSAVSGRAGAAETKQPNILFAVADDASWAHMSAYGCTFAHTPCFDRVAKEGALFKNCFTPIPKCSPSRAAILTGRNPWQLEDAFDHYGIFPSKFVVYPDLLEHAGYFVGFTGKGWAPGDWKKGGFTRNPAGVEYSNVKLTPPTTGIWPLDYAGNFAAFLKDRPQGKPFCFWYGSHEPHRPYELGSGLRFGKKLNEAVVPPYLPDDPVVRSDLLDYAVEIEWFDSQLNRMLQILQDKGELDNTIVVVTSDNGMPFPRVKGHIYEDAYHIPLAIRWPGVIKGGRVVDDFVSFIDLAPTFLEAAGMTPTTEMTGRSLMNILKSGASGHIETNRNQVLLGRERTDLGRPADVGYPVRSIRTQDYLYSRNFAPDRWPAGNPETGFPDIDESPSKALVLKLNQQGQTQYYNLAMAKRGPEELYDLKADPACVNNLADKPELAQIKAQLWEELQKQLKAQQDPRILGQGDIYDHYEWTGTRTRAWDTVMSGKKN